MKERCGCARRSAVSRAENRADIALPLFGEEDGIELELPGRQTGREPPSFA
ncbi:MAG: hypothetical protein ACREH3_13480 [Geminicoccales bacterium]